MNARIIKETRSLLPVFCVMALACIAPRLIWSRETAGGVGLGVFTICCLVLGASCFGNEYQWRTMPLLLAQPVPRRKIWNEKMLVLGTALGLGLVLFWLFVPLPESESYLFLVLVPFGVLCTAPYMALRIKNTLMAAACTFALPFGLCAMLALLWWVFGPFLFRLSMPAGHLLGSYLRQHSPATGSFLEHAFDDHPYFWIGIAAAIYCAVCYRLGYRSFMKLEAVDSQAKEIALPPRMEAALAGPLNRLLPRYGGPWASLLRKELQIQKAAFVLAGALVIASPLAGLAWHLDHSDVFAGVAAAAIAVLVFAVPFIASGMCVAEERAWGVSGWQLALPVSARKQWAAKMLTVVFVSVLLGVVTPLLLWISDGWVFQLPIGPGPLHLSGPMTPPSLEQMTFALLTLVDFILGYLFLLGLGVFTSSACANSAKAIIMNLGLIIASGSIIGGIISGLVEPIETHYVYIFRLRHPLVPITLPNGQTAYESNQVDSPMGFMGRHPQAILIVFGVLLSILLVQVLYVASANYRNGEPGSRRVWRQLATVTGSIVASALIYWALINWNMVGVVFSSR